MAKINLKAKIIKLNSNQQPTKLTTSTRPIQITNLENKLSTKLIKNHQQLKYNSQNL